MFCRKGYIISLITLIFLAMIHCARSRTQPQEQIATRTSENEQNIVRQLQCSLVDSDDFGIWNKKDETCYTPKDYCLKEKKKQGYIWSDEQKKCLSPEDLCHRKQEKHQWVAGRCLKAIDACKGKGKEYSWNSKQQSCQTSEEYCRELGYQWIFVEANSECRPRKFADYCNNADGYEDFAEKNYGIQRTISILKIELGEDNCDSIEEIMNSRESFDYNSDFKMIDPSPFISFTQLTKLMLAGQEINNVFGLSTMTQLQHLDLRNNLINDIYPLKNLRKLEFLSLGNNAINDISSLRDMKKLQSLYLNNNNITKLAPLKDLTELTTLALGENPIQDLSPLAGLMKLQSLTLENVTSVGKNENSCPIEKGPEVLKDYCRRHRNN